MKKYNQENYNRYRKDIKAALPDGLCWDEHTRDQLVIKFMPLVENLARKFSTSHQASGVMTITDMIQEGSVGLIKAVDKIIWKTIYEAEDPEKRLKSFLAKRVKGAIRRAIDNNRGSMRIPEHKLNEIRKKFDNDKKLADSFFNSIFTSIEALEDKNIIYEIPDTNKELNNKDMSKAILKILDLYLTNKESDVIKMSYGLDCDKKSATEIAKYLGIKGNSSYVRVSQLKKQALDKLKHCVKHSQVSDYL
jgi:RNA polymerase sigma factor (sigma-70 family)